MLPNFYISNSIETHLRWMECLKGSFDILPQGKYYKTKTRAQ